MKILITGAKGLLGQALAQTLKNERLVLAGRDEPDVTNLEKKMRQTAEIPYTDVQNLSERSSFGR